MEIYVVVHLYGGLLEAVKYAEDLPGAEEIAKEMLPGRHPIECDDCESYQEVFIERVTGPGIVGERLASYHTDSKSS